MFATRDELLEKIRLGESTYLEFKEVRFAGGKISGPHRDSLANGLAAFANSRGGVLLLGVDDKSHEIVGIPLGRLDDVVVFVRDICTGLIEPPLSHIAVDRRLLPSSTGDEMAIVTVEVPRSLFVHKSPGGYFQRIGDSKRSISSEYLARLFQQRSQTRIIYFDEQMVSAARLEDLSPDLWERFRTPRSDNDRGHFLTKLGMAGADEDRTLRPTISGVLLATEDPCRWLPNAYIQAVAYRGDTIHTATDGAYQLDAADITGPLDRQIVDACQFVAKNMKMAAIKDQGRGDRPQYDMSAVFEAVVNAVAHRDYSIHGSKIRLRLFENRLELYSPGTIANSMTIESMAYLQSARNDVLCSLLAKCLVPDKPWLQTDRRTIMDKRGEGVPIILENSLKLSGKEPEYRLIGDAELMLTIYAADLS